MASKNLQQRLDDAKEELASARSAIDDARRDGNRRVEADHEKMRGLARQLEKTGRALLGANNQIHTMTDRCGVLEAQLHDATTQAEKLAALLEVEQNGAAALQSTIELKEKDVDELHTQVSVLHDELQQERERWCRLAVTTEEVSHEAAKVAPLRSKQESLAGELDDVRRELRQHGALGLPFYLLNIFAEARYEGLKLAVIDDSAAALDDPAMQAIASEISAAACAFLRGQRDDGAVKVRTFGPSAEILFAGHLVMGLAHIVANSSALTPSAHQRITFVSAAGDTLGVFRSKDRIWWVDQPQPVFLPPLLLDQLSVLVPSAAKLVDTALLRSFGATTVTAAGVRLPVVSIGSACVLVPVLGRAALGAVAMCRDGSAAVTSISADLGLHRNQPTSLSLYFYHNRTPSDAEQARGAPLVIFGRMFNFVQGGEWVEDAASVAAAACLAAYLCRALERPIRARFTQGVQNARMSSIAVEACVVESETDGPKWTIRCGGRVVPIAEGRWAVPVSVTDRTAEVRWPLSEKTPQQLAQNLAAEMLHVKELAMLKSLLADAKKLAEEPQKATEQKDIALAELTTQLMALQTELYCTQAAVLEREHALADAVRTAETRHRCHAGALLEDVEMLRQATNTWS